MKQAKISKIVKFINLNKYLSANEEYNKSIYGFTTKEYKEVKKAIDNLYGMKCFWGNRIKIKEIKKYIES